MLVLDDEFVEKIAMSPEEIKPELVIAAYRENKIGWGKGAEPLGISQVQVWKELSKRELDVVTLDETYKKEFGIQ
jgi:predicted HTH domain antitoxin